MITAIIVTFNRKKDLVRCIDSVLNQSYRVTNLLLVDNASTDGTLEYLEENNITDTGDVICEKLTRVGIRNNINIYVYKNNINGGGSGGFHIGMREAYENLKSEYYWMMDDDGYASKTCLQELMEKSIDYDYIMPTSINIDNKDELSWAVRMRNGKKTIKYEELKKSWGTIMEYVTPFNGILLSKRCISEVGYINKDFFLWGDEYDHYWRCKKKGIKPVTLMDAVFYHPAQKLPLVKIMGGLFTAPYVDSELRMVCLARNYTYIYKKYGQTYKIPLKFLQYTWLFMVTRHLDIRGWKLYIESVNDGIKGDFTRHRQYLK